MAAVICTPTEIAVAQLPCSNHDIRAQRKARTAAFGNQRGVAPVLKLDPPRCECTFQALTLRVQGSEFAVSDAKLPSYREHANQRGGNGAVPTVDLGQDFDRSSGDDEYAYDLPSFQASVGAGQNGCLGQFQLGTLVLTLGSCSPVPETKGPSRKSPSSVFSCPALSIGSLYATAIWRLRAAPAHSTKYHAATGRLGASGGEEFFRRLTFSEEGAAEVEGASPVVANRPWSLYGAVAQAADLAECWVDRTE